MTKIIMMIGIPGSGKSTHARKLAILENAQLIEADLIREVLFEGKQDKETHAKVFEEVLRVSREYINTGKSIVCDATNLNYKHRMSFLSNFKKYDVVKVAHVVATELEICRERNKARSRIVPIPILNRMRENFTMPQYYEGFDEIHISFTYDAEKYVVENFREMAIDFNQENPHHTKTLWEHTIDVAGELANESVEVYSAGLFHDIGKLYTKQFKDSRGNPSNIAHYYNHESVSAYEAIFYLFNMGYATEQVIEICGLIQNHMRLYSCNTDKSKKKLLDLVGEKNYNNLLKINKADAEGK